MKIRIGFVSNSSSQNFVMVGIDIGGADIEKIKKDLIEKCGFKLPDYADTPEDISVGELTDDKYDEANEGQYFGVRIANGDEYEIFTVDFDEIGNKEKELRNILNILGFPDAKIKLIAGSEAC